MAQRISFGIKKAKENTTLTPNDSISNSKNGPDLFLDASPNKPKLAAFDSANEDLSATDPQAYWRSIHSFPANSNSSLQPTSTSTSTNLSPTISDRATDNSFYLSPLHKRSNSPPQEVADEDLPPKHGLFVPTPTSINYPPKSRYISSIKHVSKKRELELEIIQEKKLKKEREQDSERYADKEVFVTASYKQKLLERKKLQAELEEQDAQDDLNDVTKKRDLSAFHSHLLTQGQASRSKAFPAQERIENDVKKLTDSKQTAPLPSYDTTTIPTSSSISPTLGAQSSRNTYKLSTASSEAKINNTSENSHTIETFLDNLVTSNHFYPNEKFSKSQKLTHVTQPTQPQSATSKQETQEVSLTSEVSKAHFQELTQILENSIYNDETKTKHNEKIAAAKARYLERKKRSF